MKDYTPYIFIGGIVAAAFIFRDSIKKLFSGVEEITDSAGDVAGDVTKVTEKVSDMLIDNPFTTIFDKVNNYLKDGGTPSVTGATGNAIVEFFSGLFKDKNNSEMGALPTQTGAFFAQSVPSAEFVQKEMDKLSANITMANITQPSKTNYVPASLAPAQGATYADVYKQLQKEGAISATGKVTSTGVKISEGLASLAKKRGLTI